MTILGRRYDTPSFGSSVTFLIHIYKVGVGFTLESSVGRSWWMYNSLLRKSAKVGDRKDDGGRLRIVSSLFDKVGLEWV